MAADPSEARSPSGDGSSRRCHLGFVERIEVIELQPEDRMTIASATPRTSRELVRPLSGAPIRLENYLAFPVLAHGLTRD
jgi:hypothetical protein